MISEFDDDDFSVDEDEILDAIPADLPEALQELAAATVNKDAEAPNGTTSVRAAKPRPKLDSTNLLQHPTGLGQIRGLLNNLPKRLSSSRNDADELDRGLVMQDAQRVLRLCRDWAHTHLPAVTFETFCERAEKLAAKDHTLKLYFRALRERIEAGTEGDFSEALFIADAAMDEISKDANYMDNLLNEDVN